MNIIAEESGGNTRIYTFGVTGLVRRENEVNEESTKVGDPNYPSDDHSKCEQPTY